MFKVGDTDQCPGREEASTAEHILQMCQLYKELRLRTWPQPTLEAQKLYGCLVDLQRTATFISETGLTILHSRRRRTQAKNPINTRSLGLIDPTFTKASKDIALNYPTHPFHNAKGQVPFSSFFVNLLSHCL